MIFKKKFDNVYIYCPAGLVTGGAELLHQLANVINDNGGNAYIVYYGNNNTNIPTAYSSYNLKTTSKAIDEKENAIVLFEAIFDKSEQFAKAQIIFWWLSVDNFYICSREYLNVLDYFKWDLKKGSYELLYRVAKNILGKRIIIFNECSVKKLAHKNAINCYQSEYAQNFLINNGFNMMLPLKDYINTEFACKSNDVLVKKNKVLYNPKKGLKITKKLISQAPNFEWVPLQNMSREQLIGEMKTSKIYIDFGYHPGKDRIPREAALCGCCIITNKMGSANFFEDVPIFNEYKFESLKTIDLIVEKIQDIFDNYEVHNKKFDFYRSIILNEKNKFIEDAAVIFGF